MWKNESIDSEINGIYITFQPKRFPDRTSVVSHFFQNMQICFYDLYVTSSQTNIETSEKNVTYIFYLIIYK